MTFQCSAIHSLDPVCIEAERIVVLNVHLKHHSRVPRAKTTTNMSATSMAIKSWRGLRVYSPLAAWANLIRIALLRSQKAV